MSPDARNKIILGVLLAIAAGVLVWQFTKPVATPTGGAGAGAGTGTKVVVAKVEVPVLKPTDVDIDALVSRIKPVTFDYELSSIDRNPMTPLVGFVAASDQPSGAAQQTTYVEVLRKKVTGIVWDPTDPVAVVDDDVVRVGHLYPNGVQVYEIRRDEVVFRLGDQLVPVEMKEL